MEIDPVSVKLCVFEFIYNSEQWEESRNPVILGVLHNRQNPLDSTPVYILPPDSGIKFHTLDLIALTTENNGV
jgi:hypothetical protein